MKIVIAVHGTRGDIEPCAAVGRELLQRGHSVQLAVPPNLVSFVESVGFTTVVPWGPDSTSSALLGCEGGFEVDGGTCRAARERR